MRERKAEGDVAGVEAVMEKYLYRMWDLSQFMKTLKQRFTQWFNRKHGRRGTLWEDRFKSVIVEDGYAARVMAAYIDLNPLRGGICKDPAEYRWSSYGEAVAGGKKARAGLVRAVEFPFMVRGDAPSDLSGATDIEVVQAGPGEVHEWSPPNRLKIC